MTCHPSYPSNSAKARPFGTCSAYLSGAEMALPAKTASTPGTITTSQGGILVMLIPPLQFTSKSWHLSHPVLSVSIRKARRVWSARSEPRQVAQRRAHFIADAHRGHRHVGSGRGADAR